MMRETECFSINSDMSSRIRLSGALNRSSASCLTSSVLPTPVLPTKMKLTGLCLGLMPTRLRRMAAATAAMASSWPTIFFFSRLLQLAQALELLLPDLAGGDLGPQLDDPGQVVHGELGARPWL